MNPDVIFVRVWGRLVPISKATLVQVDPNTGLEVSEVPLTKPIADLVEYNLQSFVKVHESRAEFNRAVQ